MTRYAYVHRIYGQPHLPTVGNDPIPSEKPTYPIRFLVQGCPPVYTHAPTPTPNPQIHAGSVNGPPSPSKISTRMEEGTSVLFEQHCNSEGEEELSEVEADVVFQFQKLAMGRDKETDNQEDLGEGLDVDTESDQEGSDYTSDYIPTSIQGSHGHARVSNLSKTFMHKKGTKDISEGRKRNKTILSYEFCPLPHCPSILRLLTKHFCQHPLLPERHGEPRTSDLIYRDAVLETYLYCKNNHLCEVWAYLWTNWYAPDKWKLWAQSAHPHAIPQKRMAMVVEAMW